MKTQGLKDRRRAGLRGAAVVLLATLVIVPATAASTEETARWLESLVTAFDEAPGVFVEALPRGSGRGQGRGGRCDWQTLSGRTPRLTCTVTLQRLDGLQRLDLVSVDAKSPTGSGGPARVPVSARLSVASGTARVYLAVDTDLGRLAAALGGGTAPDPPVVRRGYRFAESRAGVPAVAHGDAKAFGSSLSVWVEAVGDEATGLTLEIEPR